MPCATDCYCKETTQMSNLNCATDEALDGADRYLDDYSFVGTTLSGLFRVGNLTVTDTGYLVCIDLAVRRSGIVLYGTGDSLDDAIDDVWDQLYDHNNALDHLADLGVEPLDVGRLITSTGEYDSQATPITSLDTASDTLIAQALTPVTPDPVFAAAGEPVDGPSDEPGLILALLIPVREGRA